jgi:hypothetical protein
VKKEKLSVFTQIKIGIFSGLFFASIMAGFSYLNNESFSVNEFLFYFVCFGFFMAISFRYKYTKENK